MIKEMKLMDLAKIVNEMNIGDVIAFANGDGEEAERNGGWCGAKRIDEFSNDNPMYLVSHYGGEAECVLYHLSEYDPRIGDFCSPRLEYRLDGKNRKEKDWVECCAKMIANYLMNRDGYVDSVISVEV